MFVTQSRLAHNEAVKDFKVALPFRTHPLPPGPSTFLPVYFHSFIQPARLSCKMTFASDPTYPLFPIFAFLGFILVLTPLPWHFQAWNAGTCLYMIWAAIGCLNQFVNSVVWHGNALNPAPIWCDICEYFSYYHMPDLVLNIDQLASRILVGGAVAIPAASLCINRRLYKIATATTLTNSRQDVSRDHGVYSDAI